MKIYRAKSLNGVLIEYSVVSDGDAPALPSTGTMVKNAADAIGQIIKHGAKRVSDEEQARRLGICKGCEFYIPNEEYPLLTGRCGKCGCRMKWKSLLEAWHCPIHRW